MIHLNQTKHEGLLHAWAETGTEGFIWALQEFQHMSDDGKNWSYDGLVCLEPTDEVTIYNEKKEAVWHGFVEPSWFDDKGVSWNKCGLRGWRIHWVQTGIDPKTWQDFFAKENHTATLIRRPFYRELKRKMGVKAAIEELEKALKDKPKELYHNKWLSLYQTGNYIYSHESRSNGKLVAVLVVDSTRPGKVFGRIELCPAHFDGFQLTSITGGVEHDDPVTTALHELDEEAGLKADKHDLIPLGTVRPSKSADTTVYLYMYDAKGQKPGEAKGDGSEGEQGAYCDWVSEADAINCKCPFMATMIARKALLGYSK